jgi:hypothetical protein
MTIIIKETIVLVSSFIVKHSVTSAFVGETSIEEEFHFILKVQANDRRKCQSYTKTS